MNAQVINVIPASARRWANLPKWFAMSAGVILAITGAAKLWSGFGGARILDTPEPFLEIPFRYLMLGAGLAEVGSALVCFLSTRQLLKLGVVAWLATMLVLYRVNLWWSDWRTPCPCLGTFTENLHIPAPVADDIMKIILGYLFAGSYILLFWSWRQRRNEVAKPGPPATTGA